MDKQLTDLEAELLDALKAISREAATGKGITWGALQAAIAAIAKAEGR